VEGRLPFTATSPQFWSGKVKRLKGVRSSASAGTQGMQPGPTSISKSGAMAGRWIPFRYWEDSREAEFSFRKVCTSGVQAILSSVAGLELPDLLRDPGQYVKEIADHSIVSSLEDGGVRIFVYGNDGL